MLGAVLKTYFDIGLQQKFEFGRQSGSAGAVIELAFYIVLLYQDYFLFGAVKELQILFVLLFDS
jgi:hypothetical protein